jgi:hypothetical protein
VLITIAIVDAGRSARPHMRMLQAAEAENTCRAYAAGLVTITLKPPYDQQREAAK